MQQLFFAEGMVTGNKQVELVPGLKVDQIEGQATANRLHHCGVIRIKIGRHSEVKRLSHNLRQFQHHIDILRGPGDTMKRTREAAADGIPDARPVQCCE